MIENDACGLLQNLITAPVINGLPLAEGKKVQKLSQVNQERPFEFTMNTSTWFKKCFNQDFIFCKYMLPSEYELFISTSPFWARLSFGMKRCPTFPASFSRLPLIYFNDIGGLQFLHLRSGRNSPLLSYRWVRCMKLWSSHCAFAELFFFFFFNTWNHFLFLNKATSFRFMKICYDWQTHSTTK